MHSAAATPAASQARNKRLCPDGMWARQTGGPAAAGILNDETVPGPPGRAGQGQLAGKPVSRLVVARC
jgi:hypothetical protein